VQEEFEVEYGVNLPPNIEITALGSGNASTIFGDGYIYLSYLFADDVGVDSVVVDVYGTSSRFTVPRTLLESFTKTYGPPYEPGLEEGIPIQPSGGWPVAYEEIHVKVEAIDGKGLTSEDSAMVYIEY